VDDDAWTLIEDIITDSDYYLLIIGGKYGSVDPQLEISYTEREYELAVKLKKPVMALIHGEPGKLLAEQTEDSDLRREKLAAFRKKVEQAKHVKYWSSPEDLAGKVALSWNAFRKRSPVVGWIRADLASSRESLEALTKAQNELASLKEELQAVRTQAPPGTEELAQGDGLFSIPTWAYGTWTPEGEYQRSTGTWTEVQVSWDRVFGYLGLRMMQEAATDAIKEDLERVVRYDHLEYLRERFQGFVRDKAKEAGIKKWRYGFKGVNFSDEDFQTILLQFNALGLIEHSRRNRSVKDTANYWSLTPFGHTRLVQIRAIKSGENSLDRIGQDEVIAETVSQDPEQVETPDSSND
jgi:hypothetical protein